MTLMCAACHTENRDAAKFCKACGGRLVTMSTRSAVDEAALDAVPASQPRRIGSGHRHRSAKRNRSMRWILLAALALVVAIGGASVYRSLVSRPGPAAALPTADPVTTPTLPTPAAVPAAPAPASEPTPAADPVAAPTTPVAIEAASTNRNNPRKPPPLRKTTVTPAPPAVVPPVASVPPALPVEPPPVVPSAPADPGQACTGRNFIATAQCLAKQCGMSEFSAHPRCDAVRRQQQIEEEKRNPVNAG